MTSLIFSKSIVFIDQAVDDYESLISGVAPGAEVILLDPTEDGIQQITEVLTDRTKISSLHIVSHGRPGALQLGSAQLSQETLGRYANQLKSWATALTHNADILLYGCWAATGDLGRAFVEQLSDLTGAAIAASTTLTGSAALGGDWQLEYQTGAIASPVAFQQETLEAYGCVLADALPNVLYAAILNATTGVSDIRIIDLDTGDSTLAGSLTFPTFAIARQETTGRVYYIQNNSPNLAANQVAYWDPDTNTNVIVGPTGQPVQFLKLAQSQAAQGGLIYGLDNGTNLYTIDPATGAATLQGAITGGGFSSGSGDIAFDPNDPNFFFVTAANPHTATTLGSYRLYRVDITTRLASLVGDLGLNNAPTAPIATDTGAGSLAFGLDGQLYATFRFSNRPNLYRVDPSTAAATLVGPTGPVGFPDFNDFATLPTPTPQVDIVVTKTDGLTTVSPGSPLTYTITITSTSTSLSLDGIRLEDLIDSQITNVTWSAAFSGSGGSFPAPADASGSGNNISVSVSLNAGGIVTYTISGVLSPTAAVGSVLRNNAIVTVPDGVIDPNPGDNTPTDETTVVSNSPPSTTDFTVSNILPGTPVNLSGFSANDPDGSIVSYTISTIPAIDQGILYLGNPTAGGVPLTAGQVLSPAQISQIFFQPTSGFTGGSFTYTATDNLGGVDLTPATASLSLQTNAPPATAGFTVNGIEPGVPANLTGFSATDPDGAIASYTILSLPPANQGALFLGDPTAGGVRITAGQVLSPTQISQLFFQPTGNFTGGRFTYTSTDNRGDVDPTPATAVLALSTDICGPGITRKGNNRNNRYVGTEGSDTLMGQGGRDKLLGLACDDLLNGGLGKDRLRGGSGQDLLRGKQDHDLLIGGGNRDKLNGGLGNDNLDGGSGNDILKGARGNDRLRGGDGDDSLNGGFNNDNLRADRGNDFLDSGSGRDRLRGNGGNDVVKGRQGNDNLDGGSGRDRLNGGIGNDTLNGGWGNDLLKGGRGQDRLIGNLGADRLDGGLNRDVLFGSGGNDILKGRQDRDRLVGGPGDDILNGGIGNDRVKGSKGNDFVKGGRGKDTLRGNAGDDILVGSLGLDVLTGGGGRDRFVYESSTDKGDKVTDFNAARDLIDLSQIFDSPSYSRSNPFTAYMRLVRIGTSTAVQIDSNGDARPKRFETLVTLDNIRPNRLSADNFIV